MGAALTEAGITSPPTITPDTIDALFQSGGGRGRKGEFAFALGAAMEAGSVGATPPALPEHMNHLFDFLYPVEPDDEGENDAAPAAN